MCLCQHRQGVGAAPKPQLKLRVNLFLLSRHLGRIPKGDPCRGIQVGMQAPWSLFLASGLPNLLFVSRFEGFMQHSLSLCFDLPTAEQGSQACLM